jgi:hypothetical protein
MATTAALKGPKMAKAIHAGFMSASRKPERSPVFGG